MYITVSKLNGIDALKDSNKEAAIIVIKEVCALTYSFLNKNSLFIKIWWTLKDKYSSLDITKNVYDS